MQIPDPNTTVYVIQQKYRHLDSWTTVDAGYFETYSDSLYEIKMIKQLDEFNRQFRILSIDTTLVTEIL